MKKIIFILAAVFSLIGAKAEARARKVVGGNCRLEKSQEVIALKNIDPFQSFGRFAKGSSRAGDSVDLFQDMIPGMILLTIRAKGGEAYAQVPLSEIGLSLVRSGVVVTRANGDAGEWLSCDLQVE
jgi:hypothetical protein